MTKHPTFRFSKKCLGCGKTHDYELEDNHDETSPTADVVIRMFACKTNGCGRPLIESFKHTPIINMEGVLAPDLVTG